MNIKTNSEAGLIARLVSSFSRLPPLTAQTYSESLANPHPYRARDIGAEHKPPSWQHGINV